MGINNHQPSQVIDHPKIINISTFHCNIFKAINQNFLTPMININEQQEKGLFTFYKEQEKFDKLKQEVEELSKAQRKKKKSKKHSAGAKKLSQNLYRINNRTEPQNQETEDIGPQQADSSFMDFLKGIIQKKHKIFNQFKEIEDVPFTIHQRYQNEDTVTLSRPKRTSKLLDSNQVFGKLETFSKEKGRSPKLKAKTESSESHQSVRLIRFPEQSSKIFVQNMRKLANNQKSNLINEYAYLNSYLPKSRTNLDKSRKQIHKQVSKYEQYAIDPLNSYLNEGKSLKLLKESVKLPILSQILRKKSQIKKPQEHSQQKTHAEYNRQKLSKKYLKIKRVDSRSRELFKLSLRKISNSAISTQISTIDLSKNCTKDILSADDWKQKSLILKKRFNFHV